MHEVAVAAAADLVVVAAVAAAEALVVVVGDLVVGMAAVLGWPHKWPPDPHPDRPRQ